MRLGVAGACALLVVMSIGVTSASAQTAPSVVVTPAGDLTDGQTVSVTATGLLAVSSSAGTFVPSAFQCAPEFPESAIFDFDTAINVVGPLLTEYCVYLGEFPVTQSDATTRDVTVSRTFVSSAGSAITCGVAPEDCLIVVAGVRPSAAGLASAPISFAATTPTKAECRDGGWKQLMDSRGQPFRNQGQCIREAVHAQPPT